MSNVVALPKRAAKSDRAKRDSLALVVPFPGNFRYYETILKRSQKR